MKNPPKPPANPAVEARGGRPTREEAERRRVMAVGVDPALVDPRRILAGIAVDETAPAAARVAACRTLLVAGGGVSRDALPIEPPTVDDVPADELTRRTLAIMAARGRPN